MPYGISNTRPDCSGWATVKKNNDGSFETVACHDTKQGAIAQMVAVSMSEKIEPLGDVSRRSRDEEVVAVDMDETMVTKSRYPIREVVDAVNRLAHRVIIVTGREEDQREQTVADLDFAGIGYDDLLMLPELGQDIAAFKRDAVQELMRNYEVIAFIDDNGDNRDAVESLGVYVMTPEEFVEAARESGLFDDYEDDEDEDEPELELETREVNRVAPGFMAASARRGLRLHQEGHSGDGLMPATVADARRMAEGEPLSAAKWRRIPGWIARHMMDLDAVEGDEITPGLVAMLLWGGGASKSSARRAQAYAERIVKQLEGEERKNQPRDPDGKFASTGGGASAATDGGGDGGGGAAGESKPKKAPASKKQSGYSKAKPGTEKYANDTQKKMREEQASAVGDAVLGSSERAAISGYTESGHTNINRSLRGAPPPPLSGKQQESAAKRAATINGVIDKSPPLTAPIVVHRGVRAKALGVSKTEDIEGLVGAEFTDKGIVSTSLSSKVANRFVGGIEPSVRMKVNVPAGSKAYAIPDELEYFNPINVGQSFEREVLLPSNTRFKITGFDKKTSTVTVDVVPGEGRAALDDNEPRFNPQQPRAPDGKWTSGGGGATAGDTGGDTPGGGAPSGGGSITATGAISKVYVDEDIEGMAMNGDPMYPEVVGDAIYSDQISHIEEMDSATANAVINYTGHGYVNTNKALRGAPPPPIENQQVYVEALERGKLVDTAIRTAPPLEEGVITYRGVSARALGVDTPSQAATLVGGEFSDKGIVSTSLSSDIGRSFTTMGGSTTEKTVLLEMRVPRGSKALYVEPISDATGEFEVLLPSSSKFSIIDSRIEQGNVVLTVDVKTP